MGRWSPFFFFFLLGTAAVLEGALAEKSAPPTAKKETSDGRLHISSLDGQVVHETTAKVGEVKVVELSNPSGTSFEWAYLGMQRLREAVPLDGTAEKEGEKKSGEGEKKSGDAAAADKPLTKATKLVPAKKESGDHKKGSLRRLATVKSAMPGGEVSKAVKLAAAQEPGNYFHFFVFSSKGQDPLIRAVVVRVAA